MLDTPRCVAGAGGAHEPQHHMRSSWWAWNRWWRPARISRTGADQ